MNIKWLAAAVACSGLMYCGGGSGGSTSGVDASKTIGVLGDEEVLDLCEYFASLELSPPRTVECDGFTVIIGVDSGEELERRIAGCVNELSMLDSCIATVGEAEDCVEALTAQDREPDDAICERVMDETPTPLAACATFQDVSCEPGA